MWTRARRGPVAFATTCSARPHLRVFAAQGLDTSGIRAPLRGRSKNVALHNETEQGAPGMLFEAR